MTFLEVLATALIRGGVFRIINSKGIRRYSTMFFF